MHALVDVRSRGRWRLRLWGGIGALYVVLAFTYHGGEFWFHLVLSVLWLLLAPITWWSHRTTLRRAAGQGIHAAEAGGRARPGGRGD